MEKQFRAYESLNILIVDDSNADLFLIEELLEESQDTQFHCYTCGTFQEAKDLLSKEEMGLALLDLHLPDTHGISHIEEFGKNYSHIPFIVLTGLVDRGVALNSIKKGAHDYLVKGEFDSNLLIKSILYSLERKKIREDNLVKVLEAQDKEKERIARDVHDTLGQNLTSAILQLQSLKIQLSTESRDVLESLEVATNCINDAISESRGISRSLMPQTVQKFGLESGVENIILTLDKVKECHFKLNSNIEGMRFEPKIELAFFRITQEAISNILKYSKATEVIISIDSSENALKLKIEDNGIGFDLNHPQHLKGIGLSSMRTRAEAIAASFSIKSLKNQGTTISIRTNINQINHAKN